MRLFVAINLPADVRRAVWEAAAPLRARGFPIRWVPPESLHLTLKFLGEVAEARAPEIAQGITRAVGDARRFTLPIAGFGAFPTVTRPRVVWVGCDAVPPLELLQHRLEQEMAAVGFAVEGRLFRPHLTLGRAQRDARRGALAAFAAALDPLEFAGEALVESVDLMQSQLSRAGAQYTLRHCAGLQP